jgi:hypothetical protein
MGLGVHRYYKASILSVGPQYMNLMAVTRVKWQRPALYADDIMPIEMQTIKTKKHNDTQMTTDVG